MIYRLKTAICIIVVTLLCFSCAQEFAIYNQQNTKLSSREVSSNYLVMLGNGFCHDCIVNLIAHLNANKKEYIVIYPNTPYNNFIKITLNEFLISLKVDTNNVYWIDQKDYDASFKSHKSPFVIKSSNFEQINYETLFDKDGKLKVNI